MKQKSLFFIFLLCSYFSQAQPSGWLYRMPITISNPGSNLFNVTIPIYVNTAPLVSANQMQATGNDVRFGVPCYGSTLFNYYIDSGMNSASTKFLVNIDTLLAGANRTIYMFYGNPSAVAVSTPTTAIFTNGPISADNSVSGGTSGGVALCQRGFQFVPNQEILVTSFGKNTPSSVQRYVTLFQYSTQAIIMQDTVNGPASTYSYQNLFSTSAPYTGLILSAGTNYVLEIFAPSNDGTYYYQTSSSIASQLTYINMMYCNSCTQNTFPNTTLTNYHYGYPDLQFYTLSLPSPLPIVTVGSGTSNGTPPTITSQPASVSVCTGANTSFTVAATGTGLTYQWQINTGSGFTNISNNSTYTGATAATLNLNNISLSMNGNLYQCVVSGNACAAATSNSASITIYSSPAIVVQPFSASICPGGNSGFSIIATGTSLTYQWQENSGSGFSNITNGGVYAGATSSNLNLINAPGSMAGNTYRCIVSNICNTYDTSNIVNLTVFTAPSITGQPTSLTVCESSTAIFTVNATGSSLQYQWQVNTGSGWVNLINGGGTSGVYTSALTIIFVPYSMSGNYFRCHVSAGGCNPILTTDSVLMVVHALPNVTTQPLPNASCVGGNATFTVAGVGYGLTYQWQENTGSGWNNITNGGIYNGATTDTLKLTGVTNLMNLYNYRVVLSGLCNINAYSNSVSLTINLPPTSGFTANGSTILCPGDSLQLIANQNPNYIYQWMFNGNNISGATNSTYTLHNAGSYSLTVSIGNGNCSTTSSATAVTMLTAPASTITPAGPTTFCQGQNVTLNGNIGAGLTYRWYLNGNIISGAALSSYIANVSGNYVLNTYNGSCHTNSLPTTVTVNPLPTAVINYTGTGYFCQGSSVTLPANTGTGLTYQWYSGSSMIPGATNSTYTTSTAGTYIVIVTNSYNCSDTSTTVSLTPAPVPPTTVTVSPTSATACSGNPVVLSAPTGTNLTYQWNLNGNPISGAANSSYNATASGSYTVTVTNLNGLGCAATSSPAIAVTINNNPLPPASITYSGNPVVCYGDSLRLNANAGAGYTYVWKTNGSVIAGATSSYYIAHNSGQYQVLITNSLGCIGTSSVISVGIDTPLNPTVYVNGNILHTFNGYTTYQWYKDGIAISGANTFNYNTNNVPGTYTVKVTDPAGCAKISAPHVIVGVSNVNALNDNILIYPNPATTMIYVEATVNVNVSILSIQGKLLLSRENTKEINISQLANGIYMIQVYDQDNVLLKTERFVKNSQ